MGFRASVIAAAILASQVSVALASGALASDDETLSQGVWRNKKNSVHVRAHPCGTSICGTIVWANDEAKADAREGGTPNLIGTQLFKDFRKDARGNWHGKVFVPDLGKTFSGSIKVINDNVITGTGCLIAGLFCKSQTWTRLS